MNDVDLPRELLDSTRNNIVVKSKGPHGSHQPVGDAELTPRQCGPNFYAGRNRPLQDAGKSQHVSAGGRKPVDLLPRGVADPSSPELVREAVQDANRFVRAIHRQTTRQQLLGRNAGTHRAEARHSFSVEKRSMPQFERYQRKDLFRVASSLRVLLDDALDAFSIEITPRQSFPVKQDSKGPVPQLGPEPRFIGNGKAGLLAMQNLCGNWMTQRSFHDVFRRKSPNLEILRQSGGKLEQLVVEQGNAKFNRVG